MLNPLTKRFFSSSSPPPPQITQLETLISTAISILTHHRSKTRWSYLKSHLSPTGITPSQFSQIVLTLKNNPHLVLRFFNWSQQKSLCNHNLVSYATVIHILARARRKTETKTLIRTAVRASKSDFTDLPKLFETLVKSYRECGSAPFVFDLLVQSCLESKRIDGSLAIVRMLLSRGISPKVSTCNSLVSSVLRQRGSEAGYAVYREIFGLDCEYEVKTNRVRISPNVQTFNSLILCYYQEGMLENAEKIFKEMINLDCVPNVYSYSILMAGYCDEGKMAKAEKLWEEMRGNAIKPDSVSYNTMIGGFCRISQVERAEEFFKEMELAGIESAYVTHEHLIRGYCRIGDVDSAMLLYKVMCRKDFKPEADMIEKLIGVLCVNCRVDEALECLKVAATKDEGFLASRKSYEYLIMGLCNVGQMEAGLRLQAEMIGKGFKPDIGIYNAFIDGYVKLGNEKASERLRNEMLDAQMTQSC